MSSAARDWEHVHLTTSRTRRSATPVATGCALRRAVAVRRVDVLDDRRRSRCQSLGCVPPGPRKPPLAQFRHHHRDHRSGRAADVDSAPAAAGPGNGEQRRGDRGGRGRDVRVAAASGRSRDSFARHGGGDRAERLRHSPLHRGRHGPGPARRADDGLGGQNRMVHPSHPHRHRIDRGAHRLAARRDTGAGHGALRPRSRPSGPAVHDSLACATQHQHGGTGHRYGRTCFQRLGIRRYPVRVRGVEYRHESRRRPVRAGQSDLRRPARVQYQQ